MVAPSLHYTPNPSSNVVLSQECATSTGIYSTEARNQILSLSVCLCLLLFLLFSHTCFKPINSLFQDYVSSRGSDSVIKTLSQDEGCSYDKPCPAATGVSSWPSQGGRGKGFHKVLERVRQRPSSL